MELVIMYIIGMIVGGIAMLFYIAIREVHGMIHVVDDDDEPEPYMFLEVNKDLVQKLKSGNIMKCIVIRKRK